MSDQKLAALRELSNQQNLELSKYTHFLLGLVGAAIIYALDQVTGKLTSSMWPLGCSLALWMSSFILGVLHLKLHRKIIFTNAESIMRDFSFFEMETALQPMQNKARAVSDYQLYLFIVGAVFYIGWRIFTLL